MDTQFGYTAIVTPEYINFTLMPDHRVRVTLRVRGDAEGTEGRTGVMYMPMNEAKKMADWITQLSPSPFGKS
jgi:hypothetical protein